MTKETAKKIVKDTFEKPFQKERFSKLMINLLSFERKTFTYKGNTIPKAFQGFIKTCERIGQYKDKDEKIIDILIVCLKKQNSLERARTTQRNFIEKYLKGSRGNVFKDGALVAFVSPDKADWRFSFVKIDYSFDEKGNVKEELSPARRYSFLVGENEKSHTAQACLSPLLEGDNKNPSLTALEEAFSIEKVTREFFEKYRKLFWILKEALDKIITEDKKIKADFESKKVRSSDFAKKLLGQIVFLYFLQKKGWFGVKRGKPWGTGSKHFLRELFDRRNQIYKSFNSLHNQKSSSPPDKKDSLGKGQKSYPFDKRGQSAVSLNFFNNILEPLFYEALAREHTDDYYSRFDCRIPFLNGGLFEPLGGYDWVNTDILLPDNLFSNQKQTKEGDTGDGILDIFDRYNFTVNEDEPLEKEVAVDPEMLGKVFENLLEVRDRKSKGTYYTPREIVHYMCQESLINYLCSALSSPIESQPALSLKESQKSPDKRANIFPSAEGSQGDSKNPPPTKSDISAFIKNSDSSIEHDTIYQDQQNLQTSFSDNKAISKSKGRYSKSPTPKSIIQNAFLIDKALAEIKVCDPAVGSGAFPVGMMNEIVRARLALTPHIKGALPSKKGNQARIPYRFKRHTIEHCLYGVDIDPSAIEIAKLRLWLSLVVDEEDRSTVQPLPNLDYKIVCGNSLLGLKKDDGFGTKDAFYELDKKELYKKKSLYFNETSPRKKQQYKQAIDHLIYKICGNKFDFEIHFFEVFQEKKGFDVVIANPPYVKEGVNKSAFDNLRKSPYYQGKMDLWYFFACKGIDISRSHSGVVVFIAQNNWVTSFGASKMRNKIIKDSQILNLIDFGDFKVFEAGIQTMIMLFQKNKKLKEYHFDFRRLKGGNLEPKDMISLLNKEKNQHTEYLSPKIHRKNLLNKTLTFSNPEIENILKKLSEQTNFYLTDKEVAQGIVCPQDSVNKGSQRILKNQHKIGDGIFVLSDKEKDQLPLTKKELELIKPYYTTKELFRWSGNPKNPEWIIYTDSRFKNHKIMKDYPNIKKHLDQFQKIITSDNKPYGLHRSRKESFFKGEKIIAVRKCAIPSFSYIDFDSYVSATFYVIKTTKLNMKFLTGILNSKLTAFWLRHKGKMQGSNCQIDKEPLLAIPLINLPKNKQQPVIEIMNKILSIVKPSATDYLQNSEKQTKVQKYEKQIDQLVYKLYNLTPKEIKIVEENKK